MVKEDANFTDEAQMPADGNDGLRLVDFMVTEDRPGLVRGAATPTAEYLQRIERGQTPPSEQMMDALEHDSVGAARRVLEEEIKIHPVDPLIERRDTQEK